MAFLAGQNVNVATRRWMSVTILAGILVVLSVLLYLTWYRHFGVSEETSAEGEAETADLSGR